MKELEAIKERAEVNAVLGKTASQDEAKATLKVIAALEAVQQLAEEAMGESAYLLPGGYPSKPVEARLLLTVISEALA